MIELEKAVQNIHFLSLSIKAKVIKITKIAIFHDFQGLSTF